MAQVDFDETGQVMAEMALSILGEDGGQFAILSASPDAANQNTWIAAMETALEDEKYANLECWKSSTAMTSPRRATSRPSSPLQVPGHGVDHGADLGRHRLLRPRPCRTKGSATRSRSPV